MLTSLAVVKRTCFDQSTGMWVRVQDENTAKTCKKEGNLSRPQNDKRYVETQIVIELETRRNKFKPETINVNFMQKL